MLGNIGSLELLVIMVTILLVFGAKRIPEIARGLGNGIREFREATRQIKEELRIDEDLVSDRNRAPRRSGRESMRADARSAAQNPERPVDRRAEDVVPPVTVDPPIAPAAPERAGDAEAVV